MQTPPKGLLRVVIVNSGLALVGLAGVVYQANTGAVSPLTVFGTLMWTCLGPGLLLKKPLIWRVGRVLIHAYAMGLAVLIVFAILRGALLRDPLIIGLELAMVVYLIGLRGYLNSEPARAYYAAQSSAT